LHGVPFTVKDWIETNDLPCAAGFEERRDYVPKRDATVVARMRMAGAILLGKTKPGTEDDVYPRARNPYDRSRSPGASSGGEAAIIAAGGSPLGLGSDSGGSLRWPAHCCGIATLKPTFGLVPSTGHFPRVSPMADPRTVIGPMARTVEDLRLALHTLAGPDGYDTSTVPMAFGDGNGQPEPIRVAWHTAFPGANPRREVVEAVEAAARALERHGVIVEEARPPRLDESLPITREYWARPESLSLSEWRPPWQSELTADEVERSLFDWDRFRRAMLGFMGTYDIVLSPVAASAALLLDEPISGETYLYTLPYSLTGQPVAVVRAGTSAEGLPLGVQIAGGMWCDESVLSVAATIERELGGWQAPDAGAPA
jgi:amidase